MQLDEIVYGVLSCEIAGLTVIIRRNRGVGGCFVADTLSANPLILPIKLKGYRLSFLSPERNATLNAPHRA